MKFYTVSDKKKMKEAGSKLNALDRAVLAKCDGVGMNILRVLKAGKPFINNGGSKQFATTEDILASVRKLEKLGVLERR